MPSPSSSSRARPHPRQMGCTPSSFQCDGDPSSAGARRVEVGHRRDVELEAGRLGLGHHLAVVGEGEAPVVALLDGQRDTDRGRASQGHLHRPLDVAGEEPGDVPAVAHAGRTDEVRGDGDLVHDPQGKHPGLPDRELAAASPCSCDPVVGQP